MKKIAVRFICVWGVSVMCLAGAVGCGDAARRGAAAPRNVIVLIGDGMGFQHLKAAGLYAHGRAGSLYMESLPYRAEVVTASAPKPNAEPGHVPVTDSAAAGTALATGQKVYNGVISLALPGDGTPHPTALENFAAQGKMTGLVSTAYITDATPAAFGSHATARGKRAEVVEGYLKTVRPNVIMGGGDSNEEANLTAERIQEAGYQLVTNRAELAALEAGRGSYVFGLFGKSNLPYEPQRIAAATQPEQAHLLEMPRLTEMASAALRIVSDEPNGFFLMIEGGLIDKAAHRHDLAACVGEVVEFDKTVQLVMEWAKGRKDTLVLVTADHETGGLEVVRGNGQGQLPEVIWSTGGHTGANVPLFAWGVGAKRVRGTLDNTDVFRLTMGTFRGSSVAPVQMASRELSTAAKAPAEAGAR